MYALRTTTIAAAIITLLATPSLTFAKPLRVKGKALHRHSSHRLQDYAWRSNRYRYAVRRASRPIAGAPLAYGHSYGAEDPYNPYALPGAALRRQAQINQNAPGVTNELAPGNIATATGGPSGGIPGFSGR